MNRPDPTLPLLGTYNPSGIRLMSILMMAAIAIATAALAGLAFGLPNSWFCGLLSLACMLGGADTAYRDLPRFAMAFLLCGAMLAGASIHAVFAASRERGPE
ncbi:hypothetical protein ACIQPQ_34630 [Streptomyces sp. NPDC091281]|uniref:hypothetical protein n=1 Tax=Streptomyces sp. NPDC091281 TaxID=3365985 RepID=UPI0038286A6B